MGPKPGFFVLNTGDVFAYSFQGGGGYGDPVERSPEDVEADVAAGLVSRAAAERLYGVVISSEGIDVESTLTRRAEIRGRRLGHPPVRSIDPQEVRQGRPIGDHLVVAPDTTVFCRCGECLGGLSDWKAGATRSIADPHDHAVMLELHDQLELREHACPGCGALLESEVARIGAPDLVSIQLA